MITLTIIALLTISVIMVLLALLGVVLAPLLDVAIAILCIYGALWLISMARYLLAKRKLEKE